jgi:AbrB family looped-hinge helix DNA binding protein
LSKNVRKEILGMSKLTYKFQLTLPKRVRERFALKEGDILVFLAEDSRLILTKSTES